MRISMTKMTDKNNITGVILAGGKNSRMGSDKGLLQVGGKSIMERQIEVLQSLVKEIIIIHNGNNYGHLGVKIFKDIIPDSGPMGGIYTALMVSQTSKIFILSCDMPFISSELVKMIFNEADNCDIAIPRHGKKLEPLCAVYDKSCLVTFKELLDQKALKMMDALDFFKVNEITVPQEILATQPFANINTPEDYLKITSTYKI
ncbi:molybdenum cofactor guanylyltransferase [Shivajiella indica]|uniref:Probable molybdenum cofactor guanylyltransferase n=1 Tax=Shivajiella indica TaxID=872115 RepID=A0ABW5B4G7_9BACT